MSGRRREKSREMRAQAILLVDIVDKEFKPGRQSSAQTEKYIGINANRGGDEDKELLSKARIISFFLVNFRSGYFLVLTQWHHFYIISRANKCNYYCLDSLCRP